MLFCNLKDKLHATCSMNAVTNLFMEPTAFLSYSLNTPLLAPQSATFGLTKQKENILIINNLIPSVVANQILNI